MNWLLWTFAVIGFLIVFMSYSAWLWFRARNYGIQYAHEHAEEIFGDRDVSSAEYVIGGRPFYQKPLCMKQMRELAELEEKHKNDPGKIQIDPEFYSIILIEGVSDEGGYVGKTADKTAWLGDDEHGLNSATMQTVQAYFFDCNRTSERRDMLRKYMTETSKTKEKVNEAK